MRALVSLTQDHPEMAEAEVAAVGGSMVEKLNHGLILVECRSLRVLFRLAYGKAVYQLVFSCQTPFLEKRVKSVSWMGLVKGSVAVRFSQQRSREARLADIILSGIKDSVVDLENPSTLIEFFSHDQTVWCGVQVWKNGEDFQARKPHCLPSPHPAGLHPRLARWMVNMTGAAGKSVIVDPFCGAGGLLIEAGLMGFKPVGFDILPSMIRRAKGNVKRFNIDAQLDVQDALDVKGRFAYVATDLPYGKTTYAGPKKDIRGLYQAFIRVLEKSLGRRAVVGYPDSVDFPSLINTKKLMVKGLFQYYIHRSLTKKMVVLVPLNKVNR